MAAEKLLNFKAIDHLESIQTYVPGLGISEVADQYGVPTERVAKLASAENPLGPSPRAVKAIQLALSELSLYPDWRSQSLRQAIAKHNGVNTEHVIVGCGETELISIIIRAFSEQGEEILFPIPTFPIYEQVTLVERRKPVSVHMDGNFRIDPERLLGAVTNKTRILILTSPNNPLSTVIEREKIRFLLDNTSPEVLVLLDEAYVDYSESGTQADLLSMYPNLVVLRTFSKIYGLAGLRVGYGMAHDVIIRAILKIKPTWNIGNLAATGAIAAMEDRKHHQKTQSVIQEGRDYLRKRLCEFSNVSVIMEPQANFLCVRILEPNITSTDVFEGLLQEGVIVKDCSVCYKGLGNKFLRVDVSLRPKMDKFLEQLAKILV